MALISCPECGGKVSDKAKACIHCGYPMEADNGQDGNKSYGLTLTQIPEEKQIRCLLSLFTQIFRGMPHKEVSEKIRNAPSSLVLGLREDNADWALSKLQDICPGIIKEACEETVDEYLNAMIDAKKRGDPVCPRCGSTQIAWLPRGVEGYGSLFEHHVCKKCGYSWKV